MTTSRSRPRGGGDIPDQAAWASFSIQITAQDAQNNIVTGFNGTVDITCTGILASGGGTSEAFNNGVLASHSVAISAGGSFTIAVIKTGGTETGTSSAFTVINPVPILSSMNPTSITAGSPDFTLTLTGVNFLATSIVSFNNQQVSSQYISKTQLQATIPAAVITTTGSYPVKVVNPAPGGGSATPLAFAVSNPAPSLTSMNPSSIVAGSPDFTLTLNGDNFSTTSIVSFNNQQHPATFISKNQITATIPATAVTMPGDYPVQVINPAPGGGETSLISFTVNPSHLNVQPQPEGSFGEKYQDLIPPDTTVPSYDPKRFSLITGLVKNLNGSPISDVLVNILGRMDYGTAKTNAEGRFSIPTEGGGTFTVVYQKARFINTHRKVYVPWNDIAIAETIVMIPEDTKATTLTLDGNPSTVLTHQGTIVTDDRGSRSSTVVLTGDNRAYSLDASGNVIQELTAISARATEFATENSMPAKLPPNSAYTYCVELSVDGAQRVRFDKPVVLWVDNFLGFNVGEIVPVGYYDRDRGVWVPSDNGKVIRLLDTNGDGIVDAYDDVGDDQPHGGVAGLNDPTIYKPGATYWRVTLTHFSPCDINWPYSMPADAIFPNPQGIPEADQQKNEEDDCRKSASFIEERSRIFHEDIPIPGTDMTLHYSSYRVKGFQPKITVPASGATVPASLKRIIVKMEVAGRTFEQNLNALPNQKVEFVWDGLDQLGREVSGATTAYISIGFAYDAVYNRAGISAVQAFAQAGIAATGVPMRVESILLSNYNVSIQTDKHLNVDDLGVGWTLSKHHHMNTTNPNTLYKGDGLTLNRGVGTITTVAGNGNYGFTCGNGFATAIELARPSGIATDAAGNFYFADMYNHCLRKVDTEGISTTVAGNCCVGGYSGDNGPAAAAKLLGPRAITVDGEGNLFIADMYDHRIRKVDPTGIITTVAGTGQGGYGGDNGPAIAAQLYYPFDVATDAAGNLYIADAWNNRIRKVDTAGIITTVAGTGQAGYSGDNGPATAAQLYSPSGIAVDAAGNLYIADAQNNRIRKVDPTGIITTVAGTGQGGYGGDNGPATAAQLYSPSGIAVDAPGNLYIADGQNNRIRKVNRTGIITTVAGNGYIVGELGDNGPATAAQLYAPFAIAVDASNNFYIADTGHFRIRKVSLPLGPGNVVRGQYAFADDMGFEYILDDMGLHRYTVDINTQISLRTFGYNASNQLVSITDASGNGTSIQRDTSGMPISITSPNGLTTALTVDSNNYLTKITYPDTSFYNFQYTQDGLMTAKVEPEGNRFEHIFDSSGRLTDVSDQEGGNWQYSKTPYANGDIQIQVLSAEGNLTTYLDSTDSTGAYTSRITDPSGAETVYTRSADKLTATKSLPCGINLTFKYGVDSQYQFEFVEEMREKTASGLERITLQEKIYQDTNADNIPDLITEKITLNGKLATFITSTLQSRKSLASPVGRTTTTFYDPNNLLTTKVSIPGLYDTNFGYDTRGRLTSINTDIRQTTFAYDAQGNLSSVTDPENRTTSYSYDPVGRMTGIHRSDSSSLSFTYDKNNNMTILTNPSTINHGLSYNKVNLNSSYQTPLSGSYSYLYNRDRRLLQINFPSGKQIKNIYDKDRIIQSQTPEGNIDFTYLCGSKVGSITRGTEIITYGYDGSLVTSETLNGTLDQVLNYAYNSDFNVRQFTYAGGSVNYTYDNDGLLTGAGAFVITRNAGNGFPGAVIGGTLNITRSFNGYGEIDSQNFMVNSLSLNSWNLARDKNGSILSKTETAEGMASSFSYTYDPMGRLLTVTKDGTLVEEYQYDSVGRRTYEMNVFKGISGRPITYSDEDHLLTAGDTTYQYDLDGFLTTKTQGSSIIHYNNSSRGELLSVNLPDGRLIEYINDPMGRRIAKKVDGVVTETYLWQGLTELLAVYDGSNNLVMRFEYADARMPVAMTSSGVTYYLTYDQVGSLRVVADVSGNVVKRIDYDSFGNIINDTNPSFTGPFGFAGGLNDADTRLVRFGLRDYDPDTGRWFAKDPVGFAGRDTDLYGYVQNNPVRFIDPLDCGSRLVIGILLPVQ